MNLKDEANAWIKVNCTISGEQPEFHKMINALAEHLSETVNNSLVDLGREVENSFNPRDAKDKVTQLIMEK
jgi:hypothetical protein